MRIRLVLLCLFFCFSSAVTNSQEPKLPVQPFEGKTGDIIIRSFLKLDRLLCEPGIIQMTPTIVVDVRSEVTIAGIDVAIIGGGSSPRTESTFINRSDIEGLLQGIDYVAKVTTSNTKLKTFEATYSIKDRLEVAVYNETNGTLMVRVSCGPTNGARAYFKLSALPDFRKLIVEARDQLAAAR